MKRNPSVLLGALCTALLILSASHAAAQANAKPPTQLTYQGFLTDANGVPFGNTAPVNKTVNFRIFDALTGGNTKWSASQVVTVDKGYFSVLLGQGSAIGSEPFNADLTGVFTGGGASERYLELEVDTTKIAPRLRFLPAPYALLAKSATDLVDPITGASSLSVSGGNLNVGGSLIVSSVTASGNLSVSSITASGNITATGNLTANGVVNGNGSGLTGLSASQLTTGTLPSARLSGTYSSPVTMDNAGNTFGGNGTVPLGGIIMWSGATTAIPAGWKLCDGQNGTPNLKDRFVIGAGSTYAVNATGGASTIALSANNLPNFSINYSDIFFANATNAVINNQTVISQPGVTTVEVPSKVGSNGGTDADNVGFAMSRTASYAGASTAFSIVPPYYALAFIMRVQ